MNGGSRIRTAALYAVAAATLAGGACAPGASPARIEPAPAVAPNPAAGVITGPAITDAAVSDAPGGITDGHRAADLPAISPAPPQPAPQADAGTGPTADSGYTPAD